MSSFQYVSYPIETNPQDLLAEMISFIQTRYPSWQPHDGALDTWMLQIMSSQAADLRIVASDVPDTIFRYFGSSLLNIMPIDATPARASSTWAMKDDAGYIIPAGTFVSIRDAAGTEIPFQTENDILIFSGATTTPVGGVSLVAVQEGVAGSGLGTVGGSISLLDTLEFVSFITQETVTSGGVDAETPTQYNDKLARHLRRLSTRPILPDDFADMAVEIPGVFRAIAIDGYNPADDTYNNERMVTVSAIDEAGNNLDGTTKALIDSTLQANREVNFIVNMMDPKRTQVDVTYTVLAVKGTSDVTVKADIDAALTTYLSQASWGTDPRFQNAAPTWVQVDKVYYFEVAQVISNVTGVDRLTALTINVHGNAPGVVDVALLTPATLANPGTLTGTVNLPS